MNGDRDFVVFKFADRSEAWSDIDLVRNGTFVEEKLVEQMPDPASWIQKHIVEKMVKLRGARSALGADFANVPFVYELGGQTVNSATRSLVEAAASAEGISEVIWLFPAP